MLEGPLIKPRAEAQTTPAPPLPIFLPRGFFKSSKRRRKHSLAKKMGKGGAGAQKSFLKNEGSSPPCKLWAFFNFG